MSIKELFSHYGLKNTRQRSVTYEILKSAEKPLSVEAIYLLIKEHDSNISLSTVYRILEALLAKGLVTRTTQMESNKAIFELKKPSHRHHLICTECERTVVIESCPIKGFLYELESNTGFGITGHRLEIDGICTACKDVQEETKSPER